MKKIIRVILMVLALAAVGGGGYWYYEHHIASTAAASGTTYTQVVQVTQGALDATVSVVGQLEAEQNSSLVFEQMSGTTNLLTLAVQAGNTVTEGQVLATIDPASYQQALDQATSDLQAAEETLADLQTPATALLVAQADVAVAKAQVQLQQAQAALDDLVNPDIASLQAPKAPSPKPRPASWSNSRAPPPKPSWPSWSTPSRLRRSSITGWPPRSTRMTITRTGWSWRTTR
jgi:multidrug efflux pump subunit AcrA (membrane-fusion protein)